MPLPGAPRLRLFEDHFAVVVIHFAVEQRFHVIDDAPAAGEHAVEIVFRVVPQRQLDGAPALVQPAIGVFLQAGVGLAFVDEQVHLFLIKQRADDEVAVPVELFDLLFGCFKYHFLLLCSGGMNRITAYYIARRSRVNG